MIYDVLKHQTKFQKMYNDPTITRESKLQRYLLKLKKKGLFTEEGYERIYTTGSIIA